ncbi:unnamed protein product, partial [Discosporangium mesarthrocarpum]
MAGASSLREIVRSCRRESQVQAAGPRVSLEIRVYLPSLLLLSLLILTNSSRVCLIDGEQETEMAFLGTEKSKGRKKKRFENSGLLRRGGLGLLPGGGGLLSPHNLSFPFFFFSLAPPLFPSGIVGAGGGHTLLPRRAGAP